MYLPIYICPISRHYNSSFSALFHAPWGPFLNLPLGVNLAPMGEICPLGRMFTPSFTPKGDHSLLFRVMEGRTYNFIPRELLHPQGTKFNLGGQLRPWGQSLPPGAKLRMGLLCQFCESRFCPVGKSLDNLLSSIWTTTKCPPKVADRKCTW
jgi:hypothetical protein